jgi:MFS transporter, MHS family, shikimate and dehydroshikimate transport protein
MTTMPGAKLETAARETIDIATHRRRVVISGLIGTSIEWFDFLLYGLVAPAIFDRLFFPKLDPMVGTIAVLGVFAVGWIARPLGGIVFGHFGDRIGRKSIMFITLALMGGSTTLMGLLPTYESIGVLAPTLLVILRFLQGFALGGEVVGAVVLALESAPEGKRGGFTALIQVGAAIGSLMAALAARLVAQLPEDAMLSWGWRIPFLLSFVLVLVGVYVRMKIAESPIFAQAVSTKAPERFPLVTMLKKEPKPALIVFLTTITESSMLQVFTVFALAFSIQTLGIDRAILLNGIFLGNIAGIVMNPFFGWLSDHTGRRPLIAGSLILAMIYVAFIFFPLLQTKDPTLVTLAIAIPPAFIQTMIFAVEGSWYAELFRDSRVRFSGVGFARQMGSLVGGLFPLIATSLYVATGSVWGPAGYYLLISCISLGAVYAGRETRRESLQQT